MQLNSEEAYATVFKFDTKNPEKTGSTTVRRSIQVVGEEEFLALLGVGQQVSRS